MLSDAPRAMSVRHLPPAARLYGTTLAVRRGPGRTSTRHAGHPPRATLHPLHGTEHEGREG
ncbi:MAG: hypothetical protein HOZ81_48005 [Streptomyces sp.]|nr:hypothetical protein [Streptomyces sp.]